MRAAARSFAIASHGDQRYGAHPYEVHLAAVVAIAEAAGAGDATIVAVAWLHDVLEDTSVEEAALRERFGDVVAAAVALVTDPEGADRRARKEALHRRLEALDHGEVPARAALLVKAADRLANARASRADNPRLLTMYRREHPEFRRAVHRPGLCDEVWAELDVILGDGG
ncbi:MAG: HD domain-containing protein [Myxococcales bacterium]|nr:HD domain-containing protein [Myxococcales bacterium]